MNPRRPDVLLIHADQHRFDCLGTAGNPDVETPHIDRLATDGVLYEEAFCPFPTCTPSRYSLLTGVYAHQHCGWRNQSTPLQFLDTFPRLMRDEGYRTAGVGKMHFMPTYLDVGFDSLELIEHTDPGRYEDDYHRYLRSKGLVNRIDMIDQVNDLRTESEEEYWATFGAMESNLSEADYPTTWVGDRGVEAIDSWGEEPNLLMVSFIKPHHPFDPPAPWSSMYDPEAIEILPGWTETQPEEDSTLKPGFFPFDRLDEAALRRVMAMYYATVSLIDYQVGRLIDRLKQSGRYDDTMIIYTSDHGEYLGYHHMVTKGGHLYEPLMHVPLVVKYPDSTVSPASGGRNADLLSTIDIAPTILETVRIEPGEYMNGSNLNAGGREYVFAERFYASEYMVRSQNRKLLYNSDPNHRLYFDLKTDPTEQHNLYRDPEHATDVAEMHHRLLEWLAFESPTPISRDPDAPTAPEVTKHTTDEEREEMKRYLFDKMAELR